MEVFVFPGQGSQRLGMGADLFDKVPEFKSIESQIDELLGYSLRTLCLRDPERKLHYTAYTQPALYVVNALYYLDAVAKGAKPPALVAGHSLGEFNALLAAGVIDFVTGVRLVQKRGAIMGKAVNGGMAAVLGMSAERVVQLLQQSALTELDVANFNSRTQTVISGPLADIKRAGVVFEKAGAGYVPLPVSAAFHSRYMRPASDEFAEFLRGFEFQAPRIPVVSNVTARPYGRVDPTTITRDLLARQIVSPVQWTNTVLYLLDRGVSTFTEIGPPGGVLSSLIRQIESPPVLNAREAQR
jgi:malonyl CoA-acyl carrier protein transacylase